ncbi:MAG: hypothetical protein PHW69_03025 [Elusimicrobiaceae bacterium]|nr:hypothetical protein [Elusimicrobiaceae bacterium]
MRNIIGICAMSVLLGLPAFAEPVTPVEAEAIAAEAESLATPAEEKAVQAETIAPQAGQLSLPVDILSEEAETAGSSAADSAVSPDDEKSNSPVLRASEISTRAENMAVTADTAAFDAESVALPPGPTEMPAPELTIQRIIAPGSGAETYLFKSGKTVLCAASKTKQGYLPRCAVADGKYRLLNGNGKLLDTLCYAQSQPVNCAESED